MDLIEGNAATSIRAAWIDGATVHESPDWRGRRRKRMRSREYGWMGFIGRREWAIWRGGRVTLLP